MDFFAKTDLGLVRSINQDYYIVKNTKVGIFPNLFIVADGVGGNKESGFASKYCSEFVVEQLERIDTGNDYIGELNKAIRLANTDLFYKILSKESFKGMGTTMVILTIVNGIAIVGNVGDSRCYHIRDNIIQITNDHSMAEELARELKIERFSRDYYKYKSQLTRAFGGGRSIKPDFFEKELIGGDYLLLCSDGLTNMVSNEKIQSIVINKDKTLEEKVDELINEANKNGGVDNIAVILIYVDSIDKKNQIFEKEKNKYNSTLVYNHLNNNDDENDLKIYELKKKKNLTLDDFNEGDYGDENEK